MEEQQAAEDAAFAELFQELDALNAKYAALSREEAQAATLAGNPGKIVKRAAVVAACDALGAGMGGMFLGPWGAAIGGVGASVWAAFHWKELDNFVITLKPGYTVTLNAYFSDFIADSYDDIGRAHNGSVTNILDTYTLEGTRNLSLGQFEKAISSSLLKSGYVTLPPDYTRQESIMVLMNIQNLLESNGYNTIKTLDYYISANPTSYNYCNTLKSYITGLNTVSDANLVKFNQDFRATVERSSVPSNQKERIRTAVSVGMASSSLWGYAEQ